MTFQSHSPLNRLGTAAVRENSTPAFLKRFDKVVLTCAIDLSAKAVRSVSSLISPGRALRGAAGADA